MDQDDDLCGSRLLCRLFPLPGIVLFPHVVLPLHIFEPRYVQMTEDALAADGLITMVQLTPPAEEVEGRVPPVEPVACMGKILNHVRLPDGRFNLLLLGLKRVRLIRELPSQRLYRVAEAQVMSEEPLCEPDEPRRNELLRLFRELTLKRQNLEPDLAKLLDSGLPMGALTDVITHALGLPPAIKQAFLSDSSVERRADCLIELLHQVEDQLPEFSKPHATFPPPFSVN